MSSKPLKLGVLVSGEGTNLQAIIDAIQAKSLQASITVVISNREQAPALGRARRSQVPALYLSNESEIMKVLEEHKVDLIVLAGYMKLLSPTFIARFRGRVINIHPSLLPAFPGIHSIRKAYLQGVKVTGVTVHYVDEGTDTGPIIAQEAISIESNETLESLEKKVHAVEHRLYPKVIASIIDKGGL